MTNNQLPLFYKQPIALNTGRHAELRLKQDGGYAFAAAAHAIPVVAAEVPSAIRSYPVVFAGGQAQLMAITGVAANQNLFVGEDGAWLSPHYIPAYVRRYPFILASVEGGDDFTLCFDEGAPQLSNEEGIALFDDGQASAATKDMLNFCDEYRKMHDQTAKLIETIASLDLLVSRKGEVRLGDGVTYHLTDFRTVDEEKLNALSDEDFLTLRKSGALALIYCHLASLNSWPELIRLANEQKVAQSA